NFTSCYEYNGHHAEYKTSDHNDQVRNKQSLRCFIRIDESEEYGLIVEAGAFAGERGLLLAKEFDERCNGNTSSCFYSNKTLGSSMCCCYGDLCNGPPLRAEALQFHVNQTVLAGDIGKPKSTICLRKDGLVAPCAFSRTLISMGCYGERPHHIKRFNNIGCLYRDNVTWGGSSICEQELMAGRPPFCRWNEEARHIFCCCRDDECKRLRHISLGEYGLKKNTERHSWMALSYVLWVCYISLYLIEGSTEG
uniref:Activin_recp domain-containing protein n=1 Tax=Steinernema glaseri TaxID=37863 RepID=A0A1I7YKM1_9BILA